MTAVSRSSAPQASAKPPAAPQHVVLMGREFRIRAEDDPARVQELADYVNAKIDELTKGATPLASQHMLLMTCLNLADELFKVRADHARLTARIRSSTRSLLAKLTAQPVP